MRRRWWPFRGKAGETGVVAPSLSAERWVCTAGGLGGLPLAARFDHVLRHIAGKPPWQFFVGITAFLRSPGEDGLPNEVESRELKLLEAHVRREFGRGQDSVPAGVITNGGRVQFVVYTSDPEAAKERYRRLRQEFPGFDLQLELAEDSAWAVYGQFVR